MADLDEASKYVNSEFPKLIKHVAEIREKEIQEGCEKLLEQYKKLNKGDEKG